jgi:hypothetical protein
MTVHSCDVPGCCTAAQWKRIEGFHPAIPVYLCTPHWIETSGDSWARIPEHAVVQDAEVLPDATEQRMPTPATATA